MYISDIIQKGIVNIGDLLNEENKFCSYECIIKKFPDVRWYDYVKIVNSIPKEWKTILRKN